MATWLARSREKTEKTQTGKERNACTDGQYNTSLRHCTCKAEMPHRHQNPSARFKRTLMYKTRAITESTGIRHVKTKVPALTWLVRWVVRLVSLPLYLRQERRM